VRVCLLGANLVCKLYEAWNFINLFIVLESYSLGILLLFEVMGILFLLNYLFALEINISSNNISYMCLCMSRSTHLNYSLAIVLPTQSVWRISWAHVNHFAYNVHQGQSHRLNCIDCKSHNEDSFLPKGRRAPVVLNASSESGWMFSHPLNGYKSRVIMKVRAQNTLLHGLHLVVDSRLLDFQVEWSVVSLSWDLPSWPESGHTSTPLHYFHTLE
jgi:hypothetical protein